MTHYANLMKKIGPLVHTNSIRFESKHQVFKKTAHNSNNRINILKSLNVKNQLKTAKLILDNDFTSKMSCGTILENSSVQGYKISPLANEISWVLFDNISLKRNVVVCLDVYINNEPVFGLIEHVILEDDQYFLCVKTLQTWYFDSHYFAYKVSSKENIYNIVELHKLNVKYVSNISISSHGEEFVIWDY